MLSGVGAIARVTVLLWIREVARVLHTTRRQVTAGIVVSGVLAVALGGMLAMVAASQVTVAIPAELRATILRTSFAGAVLSAGAIAVALCLSAPPRTALQNLLDLLPVGRGSARVGQLLPVLLVGFVYSVALSSTGLFVLVRAATTFAEAIGGIATYLLLIGVGLVLTVSLFTLVQSAMALLRLPAQYSAAVAGVLTLGGVMAVTVPDIFATTPADPTHTSAADLLPHRVFAAAAESAGVLPCALVAAWILVAVAVAWVAAVTYRPDSKPRPYTFLRGTRPIALRPFWGHLWAETLIAVRNPQYVMVVLITPVAILAVWFASRQPATAIVATSLAGSLTVLPFMLALYAVGRTTRFDWIATAATAHPRLRIAPKALAYFAAACVVAAPTAAASIALGLLPADDLGSTVQRWVLATLVALVAGALVPYSEQQPLSVTAGGFVLAVGYLFVTLGIGWVAQSLAPGAETLLTCAAIVGFAGAYVLLSDRQQDHGAGRA